MASRRIVHHNFKHVPVEYDGIKFASKKEARYYSELKLRDVRTNPKGDVLFFLRQAPFHLPGNVRYVVDFVVFMVDGTVRFVDVKGVCTEKYLTKKKQVEALYPITIEEVLI